jgi:hypothetical protein
MGRKSVCHDTCADHSDDQGNELMGVDSCRSVGRGQRHGDSERQGR